MTDTMTGQHMNTLDGLRRQSPVPAITRGTEIQRLLPTARNQTKYLPRSQVTYYLHVCLIFFVLLLRNEFAKESIFVDLEKWGYDLKTILQFA